MSARPTKADGAACGRLFRLAWMAWRLSPPTDRVPEVGAFVVVIDGCARGGHVRDAVGKLVHHRKQSARHCELFTIETPRGVLRRWTNCVLFVVPETAS